MGGRGLSRDDVIKAFGVKEFQKGFAYYSDGSILTAISDKKIIHGKVQGSMDRPYDVEVRLDDLWASTCSCPVGEMCKHCAAVAIAYADGKISSADDIERMVFSLSESARWRVEKNKCRSGKDGNFQQVRSHEVRWCHGMHLKRCGGAVVQ